MMTRRTLRLNLSCSSCRQRSGYQGILFGREEVSTCSRREGEAREDGEEKAWEEGEEERVAERE